MRTPSRLVVAATLSTGLLCVQPVVAQAKVHITVDLDTQTMHVESKDQTYDWKVSTGKPGYETPTGTSGVLWMDKDHHSDEYDGAYMPNAIFFKPGVAIHGFGRSPWGHAASHGCVRIPVAKSAVLWSLVKSEGGAEVTVVGKTPETTVAERAPQSREPAYDELPGYAGGRAQTARGYDARAYDQQAYGQQRYEQNPYEGRSAYDPQASARQGYDQRGYVAREDAGAGAPPPAANDGGGLFGLFR